MAPIPAAARCRVPPADNDDVTADVATWGPPSNAEPPSAADASSADPIARGRYLVDAGDCESLPHDGRRPAFRRLAPDPDSVRQGLLRQPHPRSDDRDRHLDRRPFLPGDAQGHGGRTGRHFYPVFPYPYFTKMTRADTGCDLRLSAHAAAGRAERRPTRPARLPAQHSRPAWHLERALFPPRPVPARSGQVGRMESRRLSRSGSRPLRRLPHAEEFPRRPTRRSASTRAGSSTIGLR